MLDSVGVGFAPDAADYGDKGADTLGHIYEQVDDFSLPALEALGLNKIRTGASGDLSYCNDWKGDSAIAWMSEKSSGKDSTTGHWELAGLELSEPLALFEKFPPALVRELEELTGLSFIANIASSGTKVIELFGEQHLRSGSPILYTSADSVMQIAAHEDVIDTERLYEICSKARILADRYNIGRVIARPFVHKRQGAQDGESSKFKRTSGRRDFSLKPQTTVLDELQGAGIPVNSVGKISDLFAGQGISQSFKTKTNREGMDILSGLQKSQSEGLIFANLVDFDTLYGHRRDVEGYAKCLREFDLWLPSFLKAMKSEDLLIISADHGNDPTWSGTDHTREMVPLIAVGDIKKGCYGLREGFFDVAATLAHHFGVKSSLKGRALQEGLDL